MSMHDPIADLLTRVRNTILVRRATVRVPYSKQKSHILEAMQREGYIKGVELLSDGNKKDLLVYLKYSDSGASVINSLQRVSKPGCRVFKHTGDLKPVLNGIGVEILTTPKGILSDRECRDQKVGGEVICQIW